MFDDNEAGEEIKAAVKGGEEDQATSENDTSGAEDKAGEESVEHEEPAKIIKAAEEKHEPPEGSKRWNKLYYEKKEADRQLAARDQKIAAHDTQIAERDETIEALRAHQEALAESMKKLSGEHLDSKMPDSIEDPAGYAAWMQEKIKADIAPAQTIPEIPKAAPAPAVAPEEQARIKALTDLEITTANIYGEEEYKKMIDVAKKDMAVNPALQQQFFGSPNPFQAAYEYGQKKAVEAEQARQGRINQGRVEGTTAAEPGGQKKLTSAQSEMVKKFQKIGIKIDEKSYLEELATIERGGVAK